MRPTRLIFLLAMIAVIGFLSYQRFHQRATPPVSSAPGENELVIQSIPVYHSLSLGKFEVPPKGSHDVKLVMDASMRNARLIGHFTTTNGPGIQVMLLGENQYDVFRQHQTPSGILYISKTSPSGDIQTPLPHDGTYYVIFDNSESDKPANVEANVTLRYETVHVDSGTNGKK